MIKAKVEDLRLHPLFKDQPALDMQGEEFLALVDSIEQRGLDYPIIVDQRNRILDGRHRWMAAVKLGLETLPAILRKEEDAVEVMTESLMQRRHFTKGARVYLVIPMLDGYMLSGEKRRFENLKKGDISQVLPKPAQQVSGRWSVDVAAKLGVSADIVEKAKQLHQIYAKDPEYKAQTEAQLLSGDKGLGALIAGWAGKHATKGKDRVDSPAAELVLRGVSTLVKRVDRWSSLDAEDKRLVLQQTRELAAGTPKEHCSAIAVMLSTVAKIYKDQGKGGKE